MSDTSKKPFANYVITVITSIATGAIIFISGYVFNLNGDFQVNQEIDKQQSEQITKIIDRMNKLSVDTYTSHHAEKDRELVDEKFNSIRNQIKDIKEILKNVERKVK